MNWILIFVLFGLMIIVSIIAGNLFGAFWYILVLVMFAGIIISYIQADKYNRKGE